MYFPWLNLLKGSNSFTDDDIKIFDETLFNIYDQGYFDRFNARVYKYFGITLDEAKWIQALDELSNSKLLRKTFELCHPSEGETIRSFERISDIPLGESILIPGDEDDVFVSENDIYITYSFSHDLQPEQGEARVKKFCEDASFVRPHRKQDVEGISLADEMRLYPNYIFQRTIAEKSCALNEKLELVSACDQSNKNAKVKGNFLEDLGELLLSSPYFHLHGRNIRSNTAEFDLVFNVRRLQETIFGSFSDLMVVECKNWGKKLGAPGIRDLSVKMEDIKSKTALILSRNGVTGTTNQRDAKGIIRSSWREKDQIIMVLDLSDISSVISNNKNLYSLLENKFNSVRLL